MRICPEKNLERVYRQAAGGYTLVEVMVAMTLLTVGMLGLALLQVHGNRSNRLGGSSSRAYYLAQQQMEKIISVDFDHAYLRDVNPGNNHHLDSVTDYDYFNTDVFGSPLSGGGYTLIYNVADNTPTPGTKTLVVTVVWDRGKRMRRLVFIKSKLHNA